MFEDRYNRLFEITQSVIKELIPNGVEILLPIILSGNGRLDLRLSRVVALLPDKASTQDRDHLIMVHLAVMESYLYRHGYCPTGHIVRVFSGNYQVSPEETKQSIIRDGIQCVVGTVSSSAELEALTPLKHVTDTEYSDLYERLVAVWGVRNQKEVAMIMKTRLATVHDLLPKHKIGNDFYRVRVGREEPLPLYVRNEIHHPTTKKLPDSSKFQQDKCIGYAIMEAWLSQDDLSVRDGQNF